jgi:hypothetical protein
MNIYALQGHKITVTEESISAGYELDKKRQLEHLKIGTIYTVDRTEVDSSKTYVWIKEIPGMSFNSVAFEDVAPQSEYLNKKHPDYSRFEEQ